jgi:hypothetical protein
MAREFDKAHPRAALYVVVVAIQMIAAVVFVWGEMPSFRELALNPGKQFEDIPLDDLTTIGILLVMQSAFWYRQLRVPIPPIGSNILLHHVLLFMCRLSFIFGAAAFSLVFFRHLPELGPGADIFLTVRRGLLVIVSLFALFCFTRELEQLAIAFAKRKLD